MLQCHLRNFCNGMDMIGDDRRARLIGAMAEAHLDMLLVYGNAWQCDYLRYATDFGIIEGQALALVRPSITAVRPTGYPTTTVVTLAWTPTISGPVTAPK